MNSPGAQTCVSNPNVNQRGENAIDDRIQVIVPNANFNCNGRITNVRVSMTGVFRNTLPYFQIWRPSSLNSTMYNIHYEVQLPSGNFINPPGDRFRNAYYSASLSLDSSSQIEFQSGDVIGYYQPSNPRLLRSIQTRGYISYINTVSSPSTSFDISNVDSVRTDLQPLIEITFGKISPVAMYIANKHGKWLVSYMLLANNN